VATDQQVSDPSQAAPRLTQRSAMLSSKVLQGSITFFAFLVVFAVYALWLGSDFTAAGARVLDLHGNAPLLLLGLAVLPTLVAGQFDLSISGTATLTTYLAIGLPTDQGISIVVTLLICLAVGVVAGVINGVLVVRFGINTFIATLGSGGILLGFSSVYGKGTTLTPATDGPQLPSWFSSFGSFATKAPSWLVWLGLAGALAAAVGAIRQRRPPGVSAGGWNAVSVGLPLAVAAILLALGLSEWVQETSWMVVVMLSIGAVMALLMHSTTYGRYLAATGSNPAAARLAGVNVVKETWKAYVVGGVLAASAGVFLAANQGTATPDVGSVFLLPAFAAAFLSTVVLSNGRFTVWGTLVGGAFLVWVAQGLVIGGVSFTWINVINGTVLILAVGASTVLRGRTGQTG
jgi:ribose/xylose/arabinose/galactoside ABC-type transport system permease subunit